MFVCARPDGDIRAARASGEGLYARDTRHLSELRLTVGGLAPVLLSSSMQSGHHAVINATNPTLRFGDGAEVPQETLNVRRTVLIDDRLYYRVRVRSFGLLSWSLRRSRLCSAADFADVFEVRGVGRRTEWSRPCARARWRSRALAYAGEDGERRETLVELSPAPGRIATDGRARASRGSALAAARGRYAAGDGRPRDEETRSRASRHGAGGRAARRGPREWERACTRITTDNELFDRFIDASVRDLHALMMPAPVGRCRRPGSPGMSRRSAATRCWHRASR